MSSNEHIEAIKERTHMLGIPANRVQRKVDYLTAEINQHADALARQLAEAERKNEELLSYAAALEIVMGARWVPASFHPATQFVTQGHTSAATLVEDYRRERGHWPATESEADR